MRFAPPLRNQKNLVKANPGIMNFPPPLERQARVIWMALTGLAIATIIGLVAGLVWGLGEVLRILGPVLWPLAVAGVVAYILDPVVDWLERRKIPRSRAILCVFAVALVVVLALFSSVVPQLVKETQQLGSQIPEFSRKAQERIEHWVNHPPASLRPFLEAKFPVFIAAPQIPSPHRIHVSAAGLPRGAVTAPTLKSHRATNNPGRVGPQL